MVAKLPTDANLNEIAIFDARDPGLTGYAASRREEAIALRNACFAPAPAALTGTMLRASDAVSMRWLNRSASPYAHDVEALSHVLGFAGGPVDQHGLPVRLHNRRCPRRGRNTDHAARARLAASWPWEVYRDRSHARRCGRLHEHHLARGGRCSDCLCARPLLCGH